MTCQEAEDKLWEVDVCNNCTHYNPEDIFGGRCLRIKRDVRPDEACECMEPNTLEVARQLEEIVSVLETQG